MNELAKRAGDAIQSQHAALAEAIVARQYQLQNQFWKPFGDPGRAMIVGGVGYLLTYLSEALAASDPALFAEGVVWTKSFFAGLKFPDDVLVQALECTRDVFQEMLPEDVRAVAREYVQAGLNALPRASTTLASFIQADAPLGNLAHEYLTALLRGERNTASQLILDAVKQGTTVKDIYLSVFQRSQREIGRLWQTNQVSVAQEHYCTAATQLIMSQLYPYIFSGAKNGRKLVVTCIGGELHEIGARMVADFFELEGWDTYFLGANTPTDSILRTLDERGADALAVSATMTFHVSKVAELIERVRQSGAGKNPRLLVGGYPFNLSPNLWQTLGADGYARDAQDAIGVASQLVN